MTIPVVPFEDPDQSQIVKDHMISPYSVGWWTTQTLTDIPAESVGWLVSQGWQITAVTYDATTVPPTPSYAMTRQSLQNWEILQSLLDEYTVNYNNANDANQVRYNEVVVDWTEMINSSQMHFDEQIDHQNNHVTLYLGNLDTYMAEVDGERKSSTTAARCTSC